jgi:hypothetical protein
MPRIPEVYLDSVVYIYPSVEHAEAGLAEGACGFMVRVRLNAKIGPYDAYQPYLVTNRHIIDDGNLCARVNTLDGGYDLFETKRHDWVVHPYGYDVAVYPLYPNENWNLIAIPGSDFLTVESARHWNIGPGDDVFLVSRFLGHEGHQRNRPVLHTGVISSLMPEEADGVLNWHSRLEEPSFLVETHSRPGYSGSAVYGYISPNQPHLGVDRDVTVRTFLLGIAWGYLPAKERVRSVEGDEEQWTVTLSSGMAAVAPAWHIEDVLMEDKLVAGREESELAIEQQHLKPKPGD